MISLAQILTGAKRVGISGHVRPDGDCVGSCMALCLYLKQQYPEVQVEVFLEGIPASFQFLTGVETICHEASELPHDVFFALDCGDRDRLGFAEPMFQAANHTVCIDHHISNQGYAADNYIVPTASSTSELVYTLLDSENITKEIAECLYLGIVHDTGVFQYTAAKPSTMEMAAVLMRKGIAASEIIEKTFYEKTYNQQRILGYALVNSEMHLDGKVLTAVLTWEDLMAFEVTAKDLEGIASQLRNTKGVETVAFLYELELAHDEQSEFKISLRSNELVDVSRIAASFGGGGHKKASGFNACSTAPKIIGQILTAVEDQLDRK